MVREIRSLKNLGTPMGSRNKKQKLIEDEIYDGKNWLPLKEKEPLVKLGWGTWRDLVEVAYHTLIPSIACLTVVSVPKEALPSYYLGLIVVVGLISTFRLKITE